MVKFGKLGLIALLIAVAGFGLSPLTRAQDAEDDFTVESLEAEDTAPGADYTPPLPEAPEATKFESGPMKLRVMTFNIWGIVSARERMIRAEAIGRKIAILNPDVIAIQEAFEKRHREAMLKAMKDGGYVPAEVRYFRSHAYGSGVLLISKFPVEKVIFEPYRVNSTAGDIERLGGKGVAFARLKTPWGPLDFFLTHVIARMTDAFDNQGNFIVGDPKQNDRLIQVYQIDRFVRHHRDNGARSIIAAGDFNISPEMLEYPFLTSLTGFESSFEVVNPGQNPSTFSKENKWANGEYSRIDHIFFKNYAGTEGFWVVPTASTVEMMEEFTDPKTNKPIHYSDHYGVVTDFDVITEEGGAQPSPEGVVPTPCPTEECTLTGYTDGVIHLDSSNVKYWQNLALTIFLEDYTQKDRNDPLTVPMAEVIAAGDASSPVEVTIPPEADDDIVHRLGCCCPGAEAPADSGAAE